MSAADDAILAWVECIPAQRPLHRMRLARERRRDRAANPGWESREELARLLVFYQHMIVAEGPRVASGNAVAMGEEMEGTERDD